MNNIVINYSA